MQVNGQEKKIILHDVLHSPEIRGQIFSILKIDRKGFVTILGGSCATISQNGTPYAEGHIHSQHYWIVIHTNTPSSHAAHTTIPIEPYIHDLVISPGLLHNN